MKPSRRNSPPWTPVRERIIEPAAPADASQRYTGKVAVLMGPRCFSSNETFLLMMRHGAKATLIGQRSYGSSGNPLPSDLGNGVTAMIPSWEALDPTDHPIEGHGIKPDIEVENQNPAEEAVLKAALDWLHDAAK